jgi:hypothetical protein
MSKPEMGTLQDAMTWLEEKKKERLEVKCPCCTQTVMVWRRRIYGTLIQQLCRLVAYGQGGATSGVLSKKTGGGDHAKLRWWGLVEQDPEDMTWFATAKGHEFLKGNMKIPKWIYVFNNQLQYRSEDELVRAGECTGKFSLEEIRSREGVQFPS